MLLNISLAKPALLLISKGKSRLLHNKPLGNVAALILREHKKHHLIFKILSVMAPIFTKISLVTNIVDICSPSGQVSKIDLEGSTEYLPLIEGKQ